jgi:predicted ATP-dependent protease
VKELKSAQVRLKCNAAMFKCDSTGDLTPFEGIIGQDRALSALKFGLNIRKAGFNIFVSGLAGTGKTTVIKSFLDSLATKKEIPPDWCYIYNFKDADRPSALKVPAGTGQLLHKDMKHIIDNVRRTLIQTFASKEYSNRRAELVDVLNKKREAVFNTFSQKAREKSLLLKASQVGLMLLPASGDQPMTEEAYSKLAQEQKDVLTKSREDLMKELKDHISELQAEENDVEKRLEENDREVVKFAIGHIFEEFKNKYDKLPQVIAYLGEVEQDIIENFEQFKVEPKNNVTDPMQALQEMNRKQALSKYEVNVLVDNSGLKGAPVILELNPTFTNLLGRIEKDAQFGALFTDFTMIKSGSLHRANGGFLVMRIEDLLMGFQSWEGLKRTLRDGNLLIESWAKGLVTSP